MFCWGYTINHIKYQLWRIEFWVIKGGSCWKFLEKGEIMSQYGSVAIKAIQMYTDGFVKTPQDAWMKAAGEIIGEGTYGQEKGCPKNAFLGLCEEGIVKGIPGGRYTRSKKNKEYALNAIRILKRSPGLVENKSALWNRVMAGVEKSHNGQMDVVTALWDEGLVVKK